MATTLMPSYGKQNIPVFKILRGNDPERHSILDMSVDIMLEGEVSASWLKGENHQIVPTETQKNTAYAIALQTDFDCGEQFAAAFCKDMLARHAHLSRVTVRVRERRWERVKQGAEEHNHAFLTPIVPFTWTCEVVAERTAAGDRFSVTSGVDNVCLLKTKNSGFAGFIRDKYTNLESVSKDASKSKTADRILSTRLSAEWSHSGVVAASHLFSCAAAVKSAPSYFCKARQAALDALVDKFAGPAPGGKYSHSLQETAYAMGQEVLRTCPGVDSITIATPNVHYYLYPLGKFGLENSNEVFQSTDPETSASGRIVTVLRRGKL